MIDPSLGRRARNSSNPTKALDVTNRIPLLYAAGQIGGCFDSNRLQCTCLEPNIIISSKICLQPSIRPFSETADAFYELVMRGASAVNRNHAPACSDLYVDTVRNNFPSHDSAICGSPEMTSYSNPKMPNSQNISNLWASNGASDTSPLQLNVLPIQNRRSAVSTQVQSRSTIGISITLRKRILKCTHQEQSNHKALSSQK